MCNQSDDCLSELKSLKQILAEHATVYLCDLKKHWNNNINHLLDTLNNSDNVELIKLRNIIRHGDVLEDVSESGYRSNGLYFFDKSNKDYIKIVIAGQNDDLEMNEYFIPKKFESITQFQNPYYWDQEKMQISNISFDDTKQSNVECEVYVGHILYIPFEINKYVSIITESDIKEYNLDDVWLSELDDNKTNKYKIEYKGLVYFIWDGIETINFNNLTSIFIDTNYSEIKIFGMH